MPRTLLTLVLATLAAAPIVARAQTVIPLAHPTPTIRTVRVVVANDTLDFLFDTGGGVTVISPAVAAKIGCAPSGRSVGFRMTGQMLAGPYCHDVALSLGGLALRDDAGVMDLAQMLGPSAPRVDGMISLSTQRGRALTLDFEGNQLIVETPATLEARVRDMTPLAARLATGVSGGELGVFIGVPVETTMLWLEWDSEHNARTFLAPHAAALLGVTDSTGQGAIALPLAPTVKPVIAVQTKDIIHDGVLSARFLERATWSVDLATGRMWVGAIGQVPPGA
jgi:hypothetical protein